MKTIFARILLPAMLLAGMTARGAETDYTSRIVNPSFETNGLEGWINDGFQSQTNNSPADAGWQKDGNVYAEKWVSASNKLGDASLHQIVTGLPNGQYVVRAVGHAINQNGNPPVTTGTYLYTRMGQTLITAAGEYEVTALAWYPLYADADNQMYTYFHSSNASGKGSFYNNPEFDALMDEARRSADEEHRAELYREADNIMSRTDYACLPLFYPQLMFVTKPNVKNAKLGNLIYHFRDIDMDAEQ